MHREHKDNALCALLLLLLLLLLLQEQLLAGAPARNNVDMIS